MDEDIEMNVEQYVNSAKDASTASEQSHGQDRLSFPMSPTAQYPSGTYDNPDGFSSGSGAVFGPAWRGHLSRAEARAQAFPPDRKVEGGLLPNLTGVKEAEMPQPGPRHIVTYQKESCPAEAEYEIPLPATRAPLSPLFGYEHQQRHALLPPVGPQFHPYGPQQPYFPAQQPGQHQEGLHYPPFLAAFQQLYPAHPGFYYPYKLQYQHPGNIAYPYPVLQTTRMTGPSVGHVLAASGFKGLPADPGPPDGTAGIGRLGFAHDHSTPDPACFLPTTQADSDGVTSKCLEKIIEGKVVGVTRVPMTNCILVENLPSDITQDLLTLYFENTKRSGGGDVQRVEMFQGQNKCLIFFTEAQTASSVLAMTGHKLSDQDLKVRLFFQCLGPSGGITDPRVFDMPADVILDAGHMASFLRQQLKRFDQLARTLQGLYADPTLTDTSIVITCTLSAAVTGARSLAKTWSAEVKQAVKAFLDSFTTKEIEVKSKLRHKVEEAVKRGLTDIEASNVVFEPQGSLYQFRIVGTPSEVLPIEKKICQIIEAVEKEYETEKLTGEDFIELQNHQCKLRLLKAMNLPKIVASKYEHLRVMFHDQKVLLRGYHNDVKEGKMEVLQILNSLEFKQEIFSAEAVKLLEDFHTDEYVSRKMASNQIPAVWQIQQENVVCVYALKEDEANRAMSLIKQAIHRVKLDLTEEEAMFQQGHEFYSHVQAMQKQNPGVLLLSATEDGRSLIITATDDIAQRLVKQVQDFLEINTIYTHDILVSPTRYKFLTSSWQSKLNQIVTYVQRDKVQLFSNDEPAFIARGNKQGLMVLATEMTNLLQMIVVHEKILTDDDELIFMKTGKSEAKLDKLCLTHRCAVGYEWETPGLRVKKRRTDNPNAELVEVPNPVVNANLNQVENPEVTSMSVSDADTVPRAASVQALAVVILSGEIAHQQVDVIVNSTNNDMDLKSGAISASILRVAGDGLLAECLESYPNGIRPGQIATTKGHGLKCKEVYHVTLQTWDTASSQEMLQKTVFECLTKCSESGHASIAFPALGTGVLAYPRDIVAQTLMGAVSQFRGSRQSSTPLKEVRVIVYHKDAATLKAFQHVNNQQVTTSPAVLASASAQPAVAATFQNQSTARSPSSSQSPGRLTVSIIYGEIAMQAVDVIVNSAGNDLDLTIGAISSSILKVAGQRLQDEVNETYPQGLKDGQMATSKGHGLKCRQVFHLCLSDWAGVSSKLALQQATEQVLSACQAKNYRTVAIPALGTGRLGYPCDQVAEAMMTATHRFDQANPSSSLRKITFVVYFQDKHVHMEFQRVYSQLFSSSSSVPSSLPSSSATGKRLNRAFSDPGRSHKGKPVAEVGDRKSSDVVDWECDIKGLRLVVRPGDVTEVEADAMINTVSNSLELRGLLGESLKKKCGKLLEEELLSKKADMTNSAIVATKGYNLRFRVIFHLNGDKKKGWKGLKTALDEAERHRVTSLALAPFGDNICTNKGMEKFAEDLVTAVTKFTTRKHVRLIQVVVLDDVLIAPFTTDLQTRIQRPKAGRALNKVFKGSTWLKVLKTKLGKRWFAGFVGFAVFRKEDENDVTPVSSSAPSEKSITESKPQRPESGTSDKSRLYIYAESQEDVDRFLRAFADLVKENVVSKKIEERTMQDLTPAQKQKIREIADKYNVEIHIDSALGRYKLHGYVQSVEHAQKDITEVVREAERRLQEREKETLLSDVVQWAFLEIVQTGTQLVEYEPKENMIIEKAFKKKAQTAELVDMEGKVYIVDFHSMLEYPKGNKSPDESLKVLRKIKDSDSSSGIRLPLEWSLHPKDEAVMVVSLKATDKEYADVEGNLTATLGQTSLTILSIDRIQNRPLYQQYAVKKAHMDKQNRPGLVNERILWHGTASEAIQNINNHGFNRSYCGKNATMFGDGVYFALESSYSTRKTYSPPDSSGHRYLYQCQVLVGHPVRGKQGMRFLPSRKGLVMFDSATDDVSNPSMYVIFNDTQAYPQYLIKFK